MDHDRFPGSGGAWPAGVVLEGRRAMLAVRHVWTLRITLTLTDYLKAVHACSACQYIGCLIWITMHKWSLELIDLCL